MKTMLLEDGDLVIGASSDYQMVTNAPKVRQDVRAALLEPLGNDRFHPGWGSSLQDYVGQPLTPYLHLTVVSEVNRVLGNYAAVQRDKIESDMYSDSATRFTTDEVLSSILGVSAQSSLDGMKIKVGVSTAAGSTITISEVL